MTKSVFPQFLVDFGQLLVIHVPLPHSPLPTRLPKVTSLCDLTDSSLSPKNKNSRVVTETARVISRRSVTREQGQESYSLENSRSLSDRESFLLTYGPDEKPDREENEWLKIENLHILW